MTIGQYRQCVDDGVCSVPANDYTAQLRDARKPPRWGDMESRKPVAYADKWFDPPEGSGNTQPEVEGRTIYIHGVMESGLSE